jgi:hypothetical protein
MRDHRKSERRATSTSRMPCELILGSAVLPAMLLNESAKGVGVLVSGMPNIAVGQKARLHTYRGWFECQIVYAMEVVPTTTAIYRAAGVYDEVKPPAEEEDGDDAAHVTAYDIDRFTGSTEGPWFRLGIRCRHEVKAAPAAAIPVEIRSLHLVQSIKTMLASLFDR